MRRNNGEATDVAFDAHDAQFHGRSLQLASAQDKKDSLSLLQETPMRDGETYDTERNTQTSPALLPQSMNIDTPEQGYLGQSGFMPIFSQRAQPNLVHSGTDDSDASSLSIARILRQSYAETYLEFCFPWCPILEKQDLISQSPFADSILLQQALALLGTIINPPMLQHASPQTYYERMKTLFYSNYEKNSLVRIVAITLVYWWSAGPPNLVSMDSQYWWNSVAVRLAQEIGLHREVSAGHVFRPGETASLRRLVWWTLFARERMTAICQGRPCIIHPEDCNVRLPTIEDFPENRSSQAILFTNWVKVCAIVGDVSKYLVNRNESTDFPIDLAQRLIDWVHALPDHLQLPFTASQSTHFDRHLYQLHLPYLAAITLLYMTPSAQPLPKAYTAAILSASCVARIFEDYLARGHIRFLPGVSGWCISIAILALLHARQVDRLKAGASEQIEILYLALKETSKLWHSSKMFLLGFEKLLNGPQPPNSRASTSAPLVTSVGSEAIDDLAGVDVVNYLDFFPTATIETSQLFEILLTENPPNIFMGAAWANDLTMQLHDLFDQPFEDVSFDSLML
ncbi:hypothetical protein H2204_001737 [Knufia peltigerae]|uniref:Xylanolytic transcriptional activator regulatory domain-containing protein n=1 Tax=Knufia peltigerae TaxID=1002370 RepID=A0AA39D2G2_9EURO|nr:hypothetical protein H2204_001737 [Knufia peltigerae]